VGRRALCRTAPTAARFDGTSWSSSAPANPTGTETLDGVAAFSPGDVWAVGFSGAIAHTLSEHWNGSAWTVVATADGNPASSGTNVLRAVAGVSSGDLWTVGSFLDAGGHTLTLVEHLTG